MGTPKPGAIGKSMGSVAASAKLTILARGLAPNLSAASAVARTHAAAPSLKTDELPAVKVPFSFKKAVGNLGNLAGSTRLYSSSSETTRSGFPDQSKRMRNGFRNHI